MIVIKSISILLAVYNGEKYLAEAIESVLTQNYRKFELIICDDGSTDNTRQILEKYGYDTHIKVTYQDHKGKVKAWNKAYSISSGDVICLFAHDDVLLPSNLERRAKMHEEFATCYCNGYHCDETLNIIGPIYGSTQTDLQLDRDIIKLIRGNRVGGGLISFNRDIAASVFPLPESLSFEDWWVSFVCLFNSKQIHYIEDPLILYRQASIEIPNVDERSIWNRRRHIAVYDSFLNYVRNVENMGGLNRKKLERAILENKKLTENTLNGRITFPTFRVLNGCGIKKFIISQLLAKRKLKYIEKTLIRLSKSNRRDRSF